jgi:hypothetical protein
LAQALASGQPITGVPRDVVNTMNGDHAKEHKGVGKEATLALLASNRAAAAAAIRALSDEELDRRSGVAQSRCSADLPTHAGGSCGTPQLSPREIFHPAAFIAPLFIKLLFMAQ